MYHENFLLMENKHRKLFAIKQSKRCKFMAKMHQNTFGGRAPPDPLGELICSPDSLVAMGAYFYVGGREGERKEGLFLRDRGERRKREGGKKGRRGGKMRRPSSLVAN